MIYTTTKQNSRRLKWPSRPHSVSVYYQIRADSHCGRQGCVFKYSRTECRYEISLFSRLIRSITLCSNLDHQLITNTILLTHLLYIVCAVPSVCDKKRFTGCSLPDNNKKSIIVTREYHCDKSCCATSMKMCWLKCVSIKMWSFRLNWNSEIKVKATLFLCRF